MNEATPAVNGYAQTLGRGLRVLEVLRQHATGLGVNELSGILELNRTVVYRLLGTLRVHHLVTPDSAGRFRLAAGLLGLASGVQSDLRAVVEPYLTRLADEVAATAFLTLAEGEEGVSAAVVAPRTGRLHVGYRVGVRHPLTVSAAGVAVLAGRPPVPGEREAVRLARDLGYAVTADELAVGAWGLAAPLPRNAAAGASIGVVAMTALDPETVARAVLRAAEEITVALRYSSGPAAG